jgi:opacity protein-like surface antigen
VNLVGHRFLLISLSSATFLVLPVRGDENYFGYSYGSENLPKGKWELYSWTTGRFGKGTGSYSAFDLKQEVEYGVTDRFQIALEWKENHTYFTGGAGQESADSNTPVWRNRFSNETEWERPRPSHGESFTTNFKPEITTGVTYRFASNWFLGLETRYATQLANANVRNQVDWAFSVGPALHYAVGRWWATLTWLPQVGMARRWSAVRISGFE